jgi:carbonic anhydrase/acetyltransferase-like protein (isoleucine patch superfamily)
MPLYAINGVEPSYGDGDWAAPSADVIGDVSLGDREIVLFSAMLRGDNSPLILGDDTNFQDGAVGHSDADFPLTIGARVTVGHQAILHGCTVADDCLVGMGARILNGAVIEPECIVGAGALVTEGKKFERGSLVVGAPARVVRQVTQEERQLLRASAAHYAEKAQRYAAELRRI